MSELTDKALQLLNWARSISIMTRADYTAHYRLLTKPQQLYLNKIRAISEQNTTSQFPWDPASAESNLNIQEATPSPPGPSSSRDIPANLPVPGFCGAILHDSQY